MSDKLLEFIKIMKIDIYYKSIIFLSILTTVISLTFSVEGVSNTKLLYTSFTLFIIGNLMWFSNFSIERLIIAKTQKHSGTMPRSELLSYQLIYRYIEAILNFILFVILVIIIIKIIGNKNI